ncbi:MAG: DUF3179 domain-containing protein [Spirochaetales bacterium]|nr:DUF3179 domain-containing protein [Spirochaetales bacterium]
MSDKDSWSIWDHITGECFQGEHKGKKLEIWPIFLTTVEAALHDYPDLTVSFSGYRGGKASLLYLVLRKKINAKGFIPPYFRATMAGDIDSRLDKLVQGLGVINGKSGKFYPKSAVPKGTKIVDEWRGKKIQIESGAIDGVPRATWLDSGEVPMQLLSRWYGFSFTFPGCEIYGIRS